MKHISLLAVSLLAFAACTPQIQEETEDLSNYVNPCTGTAFPAIQYPGHLALFGLV